LIKTASDSVHLSFITSVCLTVHLAMNEYKYRPSLVVLYDCDRKLRTHYLNLELGNEFWIPVLVPDSG